MLVERPDAGRKDLSPASSVLSLLNLICLVTAFGLLVPTRIYSECRQSPLRSGTAMATASMASVDTDPDDEETSPKTVKSDKREKSEREYAIVRQIGKAAVLTYVVQEEDVSSLFTLQVSPSWPWRWSDQR